jgi:hypothetical protein
MAGKRREDDRACRCDRPDVNCVRLTVRRLSSARVRELAEEIWTASTGRVLPVRPMQDPRGSRPGASAQAAYQRRRQDELQAWRHGGSAAGAAPAGGSHRRHAGRRRVAPRPATAVRPRRLPLGRLSGEGITVATTPQLVDVIGQGPPLQASDLERATTRALELLRPAA